MFTFELIPTMLKRDCRRYAVTEPETPAAGAPAAEEPADGSPASD